MSVTQHVAALLFTRFALEVGNINLLEETWIFILASKTMDEVRINIRTPRAKTSSYNFNFS
jgi:hypothetical protein